MSIVAYVSGHGLGHAAREVTILRALPTEIPLIIKSRAPEWFWCAEIARPFTLLAENFDVGCLQSDSVTVDVAATKDAWLAIDSHNRARFDTECAWLRSVGARLVVTDVASFPFTVAASIGIPSVCVANFTWADIYAEYEGFDAIVEQLRGEYALATTLLEADLALEMPYFPKRQTVGLVARVGTPRRLSDDTRRLALIYSGNWGMPFPWERLAQFEGWHFLTLTPPSQPVANLTVLDRTALPHEDLVASVDCVISKAGYGIVGECLTAGTPLVYGPRTGFAEFAALDSALQNWPGGVRLTSEAFLGAAWPLDRIPDKSIVPRLPAPGAASVVAHVTALWNGAE